MRKFSMAGVFGLFFCFCTFVMHSTSFAQDAKSASDRSGLEISSILQSEIRLLRYEDQSVLYQISRKTSGSKKFKIISLNKDGSVRASHAVPSARILKVLNGFSCIRAKGRAPSSPTQKELGKIEISDFSDLEPQEYVFYKTNDNQVVLRLYENESYFVNLPLGLFERAKALLR